MNGDVSADPYCVPNAGDGDKRLLVRLDKELAAPLDLLLTFREALAGPTEKFCDAVKVELADTGDPAIGVCVFVNGDVSAGPYCVPNVGDGGKMLVRTAFKLWLR